MNESPQPMTFHTTVLLKQGTSLSQKYVWYQDSYHRGRTCGKLENIVKMFIFFIVRKASTKRFHQMWWFQVSVMQPSGESFLCVGSERDDQGWSRKIPGCNAVGQVREGGIGFQGCGWGLWQLVGGEKSEVEANGCMGADDGLCINVGRGTGVWLTTCSSLA